MKIRFILTLASILIANVLFSITVDGHIYLENQTNHSGVEVVFEMLSPDTLSYTTYTDATGYYTFDIETGLYNVTYSKYGFLDYYTLETFYSDTTLPDVTLIEHQSLINVPSDFDSIQVAIDYSCWGDTILVQPGIYYENLSLNNDQVTIGSLYLTTQDTSYISQTIIDGGNHDSVVKFYNGPDALVGFTIRNGNAPEFGGGIRCHNADTVLSSLIISNNTAVEDGGGVYCFSSSPTIENTMICDNSAVSGGGIFSEENSAPILNNVVIKSNNGDYGIGIYFKDPSEPILNNVLIYDNNSENYSLGGGMYLRHADPILTNVTIRDNSTEAAGAIYACFHATPYLSTVNIYNNTARTNCAGILCANSGSVQFDDQNRCNIYSNQIMDNRGYGADIRLASGGSLQVIVDTFSVLTPTDYYATPIDNFTFDILHSVQDSLINQDVYVSVIGDNSNIGTTPEEAFNTIQYALSRIRSDSLNTNTIHIMPGIYSTSTTGEIFPIRCNSYVTIEGDPFYNVYLDAENEAGILISSYTKDLVVKNLIMRNGSSSLGGGLYSRNSNIILENIQISSNYAENNGGAIFSDESELVLRNVEISENDSNYKVIYSLNSTIDFINCSIVNNNSSTIMYSFGYSYYTFTNCILWNNSTYQINCNNNGQENGFTFLNTDIKEGQNAIDCNPASTIITWLDGNIDELPLFVDSGDYPYSLQDDSPCINTATADTTGLNLPDYDLAGNPRIFGGRADMGTYENQNVVGIDNCLIPCRNMLYQNYPNPFNPTTTIKFSIQNDSKVELSIYNIKGQKVKTLANNRFTKGDHSIIWNGDDKNNNPVSSGIYYYILNVNGKTATVNKCLLLK